MHRGEVLMHQPFQYLYGPVYSWRLGMSLGIDPISDEGKVCNYNCVYCQLGDTHSQISERKVFISAQAILDEILRLDSDLVIDYLTFSGRGEPTLAKNLGEMIAMVKQHRREKTAVITNAGLIGRSDVRHDLLQADCVLAKLDACDQDSFDRIDRPVAGTSFDEIMNGLVVFSREFQGKFALQMMFIDANKSEAARMAEIALRIGADEVELNTPLRPCGVSPLSEEEMAGIKKYFKDVPGVTMVYERERAAVQAMDQQETVRRHGHYDQQ